MLLRPRIFRPLVNELLSPIMANSSNGIQPAPLVIGLCGKANSGKDTIGAYLEDSWMFKQTAFAAPLKSAVSELFGVPIDMFNDRTKKEQ